MDLIRRAERANFKALVLTVDAPYLGRRLASERSKFNLPPHLKYIRLLSLDIFLIKKNLTQVIYNTLFRLANFTAKEGSSFAAIFDSMLDPSLTWKDIDWLKS